jgi:nitrogen fixation/metabolism regulation signal transduction histidine kinase
MRWSLEGKLAALLSALFLIAAASGAALQERLNDVVGATLLAAAAATLPLIWLAKRVMRPLRRLLRALSGAVGTYRDGDFSLSLIVNRNDELGDLLTAHNELGRALREQRSELAQRELLLETVTQNSPVALILVDMYHRVSYANLASRNLLNEGRSLVGQDFHQVLQQTPTPMRVAVTANEDCLFSAEMNGTDEMFHLSHRSFMLQGQSHELYLIKRMTRELSRQEVATWKKVIRVVSHELNNSLAPITSLAHSGAEITHRGDPAELAEAFAAIGERAEHLHRFILGYAAFAKLPTPQADWVLWPAFIDEVMHQQRYRLTGKLPVQPGWFDRAQIGQALINLLKNAHEAGGPPEAIELEVFEGATEHRIEVRDRGPGMSEVVMSQALLPFYSTKRGGTGLGLALAREIAEAHGGHIRLSNCESGGLCAALILPLPQANRLTEKRHAQPSDYLSAE